MKALERKRKNKRTQAILSLIVVTSLLSSGCYWKYQNVAGDPFPQADTATFEPLGESVGVMVNGGSSEPPTASISKTAVVELLATRLNEEQLFESVVFPFSPLANASPAVLLDATVHIEEKHYWGENITKAIVTGASLMVLGPVLPTHMGVVVDLSVEARSPDGKRIGTYSYRSEYDYHYTTMTPRNSKLQEWLRVARDHAVEEVLRQLKEDRSKFIQYSEVVGLSI